MLCVQSFACKYEQAYTEQRLAVFSDSATQRGGSRRVRNDEAMGLLRYCLRQERKQ